MNPTTGYIALSRVRCADDVLIMQPFEREVFTRGEPMHPNLLLDYINRRITKSELRSSHTHVHPALYYMHAEMHALRQVDLSALPRGEGRGSASETERSEALRWSRGGQDKS